MRDGTPHPAVLAPGPVREYHMYNPSSIFSIKYSIYPYIQRGRSGGGRVFFTKDSLRKWERAVCRNPCFPIPSCRGPIPGKKLRQEQHSRKRCCRCGFSHFLRSPHIGNSCLSALANLVLDRPWLAPLRGHGNDG